MKKIILSLGFCLALYSFTNAQIEIKYVGENTDLSGQTVTINNTTGLEDTLDLEVFNNTGAIQNWKITRERIDVPSSGWTDFLCWGSTAASGYCFPHYATNPWSTPGNGAEIMNGNHGSLIIHINPDDVVNGIGHYRYYVGTTTNLYMDSVDVIVQTAALSIKESKNNNNTISLNPNPADNYIIISGNSTNSNSLKITDILGNIIFEEKFTSSKKVDVNNFKNGVYVALLESNGVLTTKRFVVKH